jgi:hypothetical protein
MVLMLVAPDRLWGLAGDAMSVIVMAHGLAGGWGGAADETALTYVTTNVLQYVRADLELVESGGVVDSWADQSGNGHDYTGTGTSRPAFNATGGPNSTPIVTADGSNDSLVNSTLDLPAPATTNLTVWAIVRANAWTANRTFFASPGGSFNSCCGLAQVTATPNVNMLNENVGPGGNLTLSTWFAVECLFTGSSSDAIRFNDGAPVSGSTSGNVNASTGRTLFSRTAAAQPVSASIAEILHVSRALTSQERTDLAAYRLARYGF